MLNGWGHDMFRSWRHFGGFCGVSSLLLMTFGALLGASWALLEPVGSSWGPLGELLGALGASRGPLGSLLGSSWVPHRSSWVLFYTAQYYSVLQDRGASERPILYYPNTILHYKTEGPQRQHRGGYAGSYSVLRNTVLYYETQGPQRHQSGGCAGS